MSATRNLNNDWQYMPRDVFGAEASAFDDRGWQTISIPHSNKLLPHRYFDENEYQFVSWYRKTINLPKFAQDSKVFLDFQGVMLSCQVFANGKKITEHRCGYTPFTADLTGIAESGKTVQIAVRVDSIEDKDIPPFGFVVDYMTFGGIYRDVALRICNESFIRDLFAKSVNLLSAPSLEVDVEVQSPAEAQSLRLELRNQADQTVAEKTVQASGSMRKIELTDLRDIKLWSINSPNLYNIQVELLGSDGSILDSYSTKFGFRDARYCEDGAFRLNGEKLKLFGLNRHQNYPYIGAAAPERLQKRDADILKYELGCNIVRTSHYPQSPHFLDRCDEIGLLVFEEIPGWQHIGDEAWKNASKQNVRDMILRDRNHPSIILWGVRINESPDDHDFYADTNRIAHELDPTRQTGGVRDWLESELLENVYTFNDFSGGIREPSHIPHMITEFCGHMYPTKTWDCEDRRLEHALRHARIHSAQFSNDRVAGALGWCAFDYNTHKDFGSGDRICYHGVCDIFRLPKWAAYFYGSQADPTDRVVLELASLWTAGERSGGSVDPIVVFSNCDSIDLYIGENLKGKFFPSAAEYPGLPHPPFVIPGRWWPWGDAEQAIRIEGYVEDRKVTEILKGGNTMPTSIDLWSDSDELFADGQDMTAVNFRIVDQYGNVLPYADNVITLGLEGPAELIGTNPFNPLGGQGALYVRSGRTPGMVTIKAVSTGLPESAITINIRPASEAINLHYHPLSL